MDEPVDDLDGRLSRLAPPVDVDAALADVHTAGRRRQVRQRGLAVAALVLVVVVLASSVALARRSGDEMDLVASDPDPATEVVGPDRAGTTAPRGPGSIVTDPSEPDEPPTSVATDPTATTTAPPFGSTTVPGVGNPDPDPSLPPIEQPTAGPLARPDELDVVITPERSSVAVGERVRFRVDVTNRSSERALFHSGGCGPIEAIASGPNGATGSPAAQWDGVTPIGTFTQTHDVAARPYPSNPNIGSGVQYCTADLRSDALAPGATVSRSYVVDAVVVPGRVGSPPPVSVTAGVDVILGPGIFGPVERRTASATVAVTDDPRAHASPSAFLAQVESSPIFEQWLQTHPPLTDSLRYTVTVSYANGGFELFVDNRSERLRVRGDPATGAITEMRSIRAGDAPGDDPDATPLNGPDEILFSG